MQGLTIAIRLMRQVPNELFVLQNLRFLNLSKNCVKEIPSNIKQLCNLEMLDISENQLVSLPSEFFFLSRLEILDISKNQFSVFPEVICLLHSLKDLAIHSNKLTEFPIGVGLLPLQTFSYLSPKDNPLHCLTGHPKEIVESNKLHSHLKEKAKARIHSHRMKVIFMGPRKSGKTTLFRFITNPSLKFSNREKEEKKKSARRRMERLSLSAQQDSIEIKHVKMEFSKDTVVELACWDLAGDPIYSPIHSFFMTNRTLYIVVIDLLSFKEMAQTNNNQTNNHQPSNQHQGAQQTNSTEKSQQEQQQQVFNIEYQLQSISARFPRAPILVVGTHSSNLSKSQIQTVFSKLKEFYLPKYNIQLFTHIDLLSGEGLKSFTKDFVTIAKKCIYIYEQIPASYMVVEQKMKEIRKILTAPVVNWSQFEQIVGNTSLSEMEATIVAQYLHDLGSILWFNTTSLSNTVFLDSQWLVDMFSAVISIKQNRAEITKRQLKNLWLPPIFPQKIHGTLISLLNKFDVAFWMEEKELLCIPSILPQGVPKDIDLYWTPITTLLKERRLTGLVEKEGKKGIKQYSRFFFFEFLPISFHHLLMVRLLKSGWKMQVGWDEGFVLVNASGEAEEEQLRVEVTPSLHLLQLYVRSYGKSAFVSSLLEGISKLIQDWLPQVKFSTHIPCFHCISRNSPSPSTWDISFLESCVINAKYFITCGDLPISVANLAPELFIDCLSSIPNLSFFFSFHSPFSRFFG